MTSLLDDFWTHQKSSIIHIQSKILNDKLLMAGRRPNQLEDPTQALLIRAVLAIAACNSDSPALVGSDAPKFDEVPKGKDLSAFGHRRREVATTLAHQALALADAQGVFRQSSPDALALMVMLADVQRFVLDEDEGGRPYINACISAIKERSYAALRPESDLGNTVLNEAASWSCVLVDAFTSAHRGSTLQISDDELSVFIGFSHAVYAKKPALADIRAALFATKPEAFFWPIVYFWTSLLVLVRRFAKDISGPIARTFDFPDAAFHSAMDDFEQLLAWSMEAVNFIQTEEVPRDVAQAQQEQVHMDVVGSIPTGLFIAQRLVFFFQHQVDKFERQRIVGSGLTLVEDDRTVDARVAGVRARLVPMLRSVALDYADRMAAYPLQEMLRYGSIVAGRHEWLALVAQTLLDMPLEHEGGPAGFDVPTKIRKCEACVLYCSTATTEGPAQGH
jgi:hypothetical protein